MRVRVYYNLHKKLFSVQDIKTRRVIAHVASLYLRDVTFKVYEAGRQRVLKEKRKNVHAYVVGTISFAEIVVDGREVSYNPYLGPSFFEVKTGKPIFTAEAAFLIGKKAAVYQPTARSLK